MAFASRLSLTLDDFAGWQTKLATIRERNKFMFKNELMSDIQFTFQDPENHEQRLAIPAHKYVLAISSPVFQSMFYGELQEKNDQIYLPDCSYEVFSEFLQYLYCDEVDITIQTAVGLLYLSMKYMIPLLATKASLFLKENVIPENVFELLYQARHFNDRCLEMRCWEIVDIITEECLTSEGFLILDQATLTQLLRRDTLLIDEETLFKAAILWARRKCRERRLKEDGKNLRDILGDALYQIRFPLMKQEWFAKEVASGDLLQHQEALNVLLHFNSVAGATLHFPDRKRQCTNFSRCNRLKKSPSFFSEKSRALSTSSSCLEDISFSVDKDVLVAGARVFTGPSLETLPLTLQLNLMDGEDNNMAEVVTRQIQTDLRDDRHGVDILFERPILLMGGNSLHCRVTATCTLKKQEHVTLKFSSDRDFLSHKTTNGVRFAFATVSGQGHLQEILFFPLS